MGSAQVQGELWDAAAANWAELQEPTGSPLWRVMFDAAGVSDGTWLLDAGCGAGGASVIAADRGAKVSGIDASPALIEIARERLPNGDFRIGDLEALPFEDATFDVVDPP